jgi:hypothetical protein
LLVGANAHGRPTAGGLAFAAPYCDHSFVGVRIYIEAVVSRLLHGERLVRRVHFIDFVVIQPAHVQVQCALVQLQLHGVLADIGQGQAGFGVDTRQAGADVDFGARILVRPNIVRIGQRTVQFAGHPIASSLRLHRDRAIHVLKACGSRGRVGFRPLSSAPTVVIRVRISLRT